MLEPLARVLRSAREEAGLLQLDIAARAGVSRSVITKFEMHQVVPEIGLDPLVGAYAEECGVPWLELWERAMLAAKVSL